MNRILILIIIGIVVVACSKTKEEIEPSEIMGNWYYIDSATRHPFEYHEIKIDSSAFHFFLGGFTQSIPLYYHIKSDTMYFTASDTTWPVWVFKKVKPDTLVVNLLENLDEPKRTLTIARLAKGRKYIPDYVKSGWRTNPDSLNEIMRTYYFRRYNEYRVRNGLTTVED